MDFEIIAETEIVSVRRGRKSSVSPELVKALGSLKVGQAVRIPSLACDPKADDFGTQKSSKSASIRNAGTSAGVKVEILWSPEGVPQVKIKSLVKGKK
jgi:hypothetical protein